MATANLKNMQHNLLEYVVMNHEEVFKITKDNSSLYNGKLLPPHLLEKIIAKSKELHWTMHKNFLSDLLSMRDILQWKNIDLILHPKQAVSNCFRERILDQMAKLTHPIRTFSISLFKISKKGMDNLCSMGSETECLDLVYHSRTTNIFLNDSFPKLKRLHLTTVYRRNGILHLDFTRFSETLEELKIEGDCLDDFTFMSIASLKKLQVLALPYIETNYNEFPNILSSLDQLRTLDIRGISSFSDNYFPYSKFIEAIITHPNLKYFETSHDWYSSGESEAISKMLMCRRWKNVGCHFGQDYMSNLPTYSELKSMADKVFGSYEETILSTYNTYRNQCSLSNEKFNLEALNYASIKQAESLEMFENVLLDAYVIDFFKYEDVVYKYFKECQPTRNFMKKLINFMCSLFENHLSFEERAKKVERSETFGVLTKILYPCMARTILEIIQKDLNKSLSRKLLLIVLQCYYLLIDMTKEHDLNDVCIRAYKNNFVDDEATAAIKKMLEILSRKI